MSTHDEFSLIFVRIFVQFASVVVTFFLKNAVFSSQNKQKHIENQKVETHSFPVVPVALDNSQ